MSFGERLQRRFCNVMRSFLKGICLTLFEGLLVYRSYLYLRLDEVVFYFSMKSDQPSATKQEFCLFIWNKSTPNICPTISVQETMTNQQLLKFPMRQIILIIFLSLLPIFVIMGTLLLGVNLPLSLFYSGIHHPHWNQGAYFNGSISAFLPGLLGTATVEIISNLLQRCK